ncbi:membrane protein [Mycobacterium tuberculosis]|nr:membrane protein [Mycobacterium tuberculosis variant africanum]AMC67164.1 membrane protein [Mycobacterium tuberculosis]
MDVALGVAVTDRVARLALVDSAAPGTVIDQFVLDVAEHPVEVLTETVVGTDRSLAGENHRLVATRLCWPDQAKADELQHALQDSGVHDVAVISEAQAATALVGRHMPALPCCWWVMRRQPYRWLVTRTRRRRWWPSRRWRAPTPHRPSIP